MLVEREIIESSSSSGSDWAIETFPISSSGSCGCSTVIVGGATVRVLDLEREEDTVLLPCIMEAARFLKEDPMVEAAVGIVRLHSVDRLRDEHTFWSTLSFITKLLDAG